MSESELKRIREAFKRVSNVSGFISKSSFLKEVLGEGVPRNIAEVSKFSAVFPLSINIL